MTRKFDLYDEQINRISEEVGIDPLLIKAMMRVESGGRKDVVSSKGATGLLQLSKIALRDIGMEGTNMTDPEQNIRAGAVYMVKMLDRFKGNINHALAAYNAGPTITAKKLKDTGEIPQFKETVNHVKKVNAFYAAYKKRSEIVPEGPIKAPDTQPQVSGVVEPKSKNFFELGVEKFSPFLSPREATAADLISFNQNNIEPQNIQGPKDVFASGQIDIQEPISTSDGPKDIFAGEVPEESFLDRGKQIGRDLGIGYLGGAETSLALGTGVAQWLVGSAIKAPYSAYKALAPKSDLDISDPEAAVKERDVFREAIDFGVSKLIPAFEPKTKIGQEITEGIGGAIEFITTPARWVNEKAREKGWDNVGYLAGLGAELAIFKGLHVGGKKAGAKLKASTRKLKTKLKKASVDELKEASELFEAAGELDLGNKVRDAALLEDAAERGKAIGDLDIGEAILKEEVKGLEAREAKPKDVLADKPSELLKPEGPERTNIESQEHIKRISNIKSQLDKLVKKTPVFTEKNKSNIRWAREKIIQEERNAKTIREDRKQIEAKTQEKIKPKEEVKEEILITYKKSSDAITDGWSLNKDTFKSFEKAKEKLETLRQKFEPELTAEEGIGEVQVVKIGKNSYRVGVKEDLKITPEIEDIVRKSFGEEDLPYGNLIAVEEVREAPIVSAKLVPEMAESKLREIGESLFEISPEGARMKSGIDVQKGIEDISSLLGDTYVRDPRYSDIIDAGDRMIEILRREGNVSSKPKNIMRHPIEEKANSGSEIVLKENMEAFKNAFDALDYMEKNKIGGKPWEDPDLGWVIERGGRVNAEIEANKAVARGEGSFTNMLKKILKNQKGSLNLERLSTKQKEQLRQMTNRAIGAGMDLDSYLIRSGMESNQAKQLKDLAKKLIISNPDRGVKEPYVSNFETGEIVSTRTPKKFRGKELGEMVIREGEVDVIRAGKDLVDRSFAARIFRNPIRSFIEAGSNIKKMLYDEGYRVIERDIMREIKIEQKEINSLRKQYSSKEARNVGLYAISKELGGPEKLKFSKYKDKDVPNILTPKEQKLYDWLRNKFDVWFPRVNDMKSSIGKKPMKKVDDYFTFMQALSWSEKMGFKTNLVGDSGSTIRERFRQYKDTPFRFAKRRSKGAKYKIEIDPFHVYESYMLQAVRHVRMSPLVAKVAALRKVLNVPKEKKRYYLKNEKPNLDLFLLDWSNHLAGRSPRVRYLDRTLNILNKNLAFATLSGNVRSALIQPSALRNTNALVGTGNLISGLSKSFNPSAFAEAFRKSNVLELRSYNVAIEQAMGATVGKKLGRAKQKAAQALMWPLKALDIHSAVATWHGAVRQAKKMVKEGELHESEIYRYADDVVIRTQASGLPGDLAPIQRTALGKSLTLFQTFVINDWNFFHEEVLGIKGSVPKTSKNMGRIIRWVAGTMLMNSMYEDVLKVKSPFPTPIRAAWKSIEADDNLMNMSAKVFGEILEPIPILSSLRYGSHPLGAPAEWFGKVGESLSNSPFKQEWYQTVAEGLGIPGTRQVIKSIKGIKRDSDLWEQIVGPVEKPKRKRKASGGFGKF